MSGMSFCSLMNIFLIPLFVAMLRIPYSILMGFIIIFASIGAYSVNNSMFDVWMMVGFGLLGYAMKKLKYPIVPFILAMVLGNCSRSPSARPWSCPPEVSMFLHPADHARVSADCAARLLQPADPDGSEESRLRQDRHQRRVL